MDFKKGNVFTLVFIAVKMSMLQKSVSAKGIVLAQKCHATSH